MLISRKDIITNINCNNPETHTLVYKPRNICPRITPKIIHEHKMNTCPCYNEIYTFNEPIKEIKINKMPDYAREYNCKITKPCPDCYQQQFNMPLIPKNVNSCPSISNFMNYSTFDRTKVIDSMSKVENVKTNPNIFNGMTTLSYSPYTCLNNN